MDNINILDLVDQHFVMECINPESLLHWEYDLEDPAMESENENEKVVKYYPIYVFLMHTGTPLSTLIKMYTKDEFSHATLSFDSSLTRMYSFGSKKLDDDIDIAGPENGFAIDDINNSIYTNAKRRIHYGLYVIFVTAKARKKMMKKVQYFIDNQSKFRYDIVGLITYAMHLPREKQYAYFCSGFVADILQEGEVLGDKRSYSRYSPQDLANLPMAYRIDDGEDFSEYRESKVRSKLKSTWNKFVRESKIDPKKNTLVIV